jgi:hypothetical protein
MRTRVHRCGVVAALLLAAGVVGVVVPVTTAGSIPRQAASESVRVYAKLSGSGPVPLLEFGGTGEQDPGAASRFQIKGFLRRVPCPGRTYHFRITAARGSTSTTYDAALVLNRSRRTALPCSVKLARGLGRKFVRIEIDPKAGSDGASIVVTGRRYSDTVIEGSLITRSVVCRDAWLRVRFSSPSKPVSLLYEIRFQKATLNGLPCSYFARA